jgi:hypothetical protein
MATSSVMKYDPVLVMSSEMEPKVRIRVALATDRNEWVRMQFALWPVVLGNDTQLNQRRISNRLENVNGAC